MKKLLLLFAVLLTMSSDFAKAQATATVTAANFDIFGSGTKIRFDIYVLRTSAQPYNMGSSSFVLDFPNGVIGNPVISNASPRFTGSGYDPMEAITFFNQQVALQINYVSGPGAEVLSDPGINGYGERVATLTLDIFQNVQAQITWDPSSSDIVTPTFQPIVISTYNGFFNGTLPVELTSFTSAVTGNSVSLKWSTSSETNNDGFSIERRSSETGEWKNAGFVKGNGNSNQPKEYSFRDANLLKGSYQYRLKQIDFNGNFEYFNLSNEIVIGAPSRFELAQNYPNPFNPSTTISFSLPYDSKVVLEVFDLSGKMIARLLNNEFRTADYHSVKFDASSLSSGMYFYTLKAEQNSATGKMLLVK